MDVGQRIHFPNARLRPFQLVDGNQIEFVQQDHIREGDLLPGFRAVGQFLFQIPGVHDGDDAIQPERFSQLRHGKSLSDRTGVGQPGCFHQDIVEALLLLEEIAEAFNQVPSNPTAKAAIVQLHDLLVHSDDQLIVDADGSKLVDDDGAFITVLLRQQVIEQRGFARSKEARQHRYRNGLFQFHA